MQTPLDDDGGWRHYIMTTLGLHYVVTMHFGIVCVHDTTSNSIWDWSRGPGSQGNGGMRRWGHRSTGTYLILLAPLYYVWIFHVFHFWVGFKVPPPPNCQPLTVFCLCTVELALISRQTSQTAVRTYVLPQQRWYYFLKHVSTHPVTSKSYIILKKHVGEKLHSDKIPCHMSHSGGAHSYR